ncbi:MAG TPA: heme biosynthesis HemY N-terminal domain-containing protein [Burkholderiales bacterium]|nr:heme biosynthesis HemY N-terminal domain-containing protein [Burkholderiales bacterium]
MRWLVTFVVVAALAVAFALAARYGEGYALFVYPPWRIEISLTLFLLASLALFAAVYGLLRLASHTARLPQHVAAFRRRARASRAHEALRQAWQAFLEGRFGRAEKLAGRAYGLDESPGVAALLAARSAHAMRDPVRRAHWLARAVDAAGASRYARLAAEAEAAIDERRFEEARETLHELHATGPRHAATLRLLLRAEQGLQNWDEVLRLLRILEKRDAVPAEFAAQLRITATIENLRRKALDADALAAYWAKLPAADRTRTRVAATAARLFIDLGDCARAHPVIRDALEEQWSSELVALYGECRGGDDDLARIEQCERWLREHPRDPGLLLALGRLCAGRELWGKAQSYLDASLSAQPSRAGHVELARLFERIEREADANRHYRAAADPALPA